MAAETPKFVTKAKRKAWQPYVDSMIRRQMNKGIDQEDAVEHALDLRDDNIKAGKKPPKYGRK
jgi:hypothetical protein